jgi:uncharacterized 2Fe-2S/4Fe-4S cluster protein (DUF4445 family)
VGADTTAAVLAAGLDKDEGLNLLVDIGTNGEIVLGGSAGFTACSAAAGPAFEGAHIHNGRGGVPGAIDSVSFSGPCLEWTTIGGEKPTGICGSGIVSLLACLLEKGLVDETGRMVSPHEASSPESPAYAFRGRLTEYGGEPAFCVAPAEESARGCDILFTQKDVREIQLAKAALTAGIETLVKKSGSDEKNISALYLAGGFGSYINAKSALAIGLLPAGLANRIKVIGNAAGRGAAMYLLSEEARSRCQKIKSITCCVELSSSSEFQELYIEKMLFPRNNGQMS